ncbi:MAG: hypothetical protein RR365_06245 [Bacteroides sp.]
MKIITNISKEEASAIKKALPNTHIALTRHNRYMEESRPAIKLLENLRSRRIVRQKYD